MNYKNQKGFTLIEVIVVAGIIAILAGILVPMIFNQIDESKKTRAQADLKSIQTAISKFRLDNGAWPNRTAGKDALTNTIGVLTSGGTQPTNAPAKFWPTDSACESLKNYLGPENALGYSTATWKGPYMSSTDADPWGNTYLVGAKNFENQVDSAGAVVLPDVTALPVWIISAGPDGILQTEIDSPLCYDGKIDPSTDKALAGDDICLRFK